MSYFLSICIPTYNGGDNLKYNVNKLIKMQPEFGFEVCISDNASDDDTQEFMEDIIGKYDFVRYHRNGENLGIAYNFDYALNMGNGKYRWLLGDDDEIIEENLGKVVSSLKEYKPDICVVNGAEPRKKNVPKVLYLESGLYENKNEVLAHVGEHMSWISSLILEQTVVRKIDIKSINNNAFPHLIELLKYNENNCNVYWINNICVKSQQETRHRYTNQIVEYFIKDWYNITLNLDKYSQDSKREFLKAIIKRIFTNKAILVLRSRNIINKQNVCKVKKELKHYPLSFRIKMNLIIYIPSNFLKYLYKFYKCVM